MFGFIKNLFRKRSAQEHLSHNDNDAPQTSLHNTLSSPGLPPQTPSATPIASPFSPASTPAPLATAPEPSAAAGTATATFAPPPRSRSKTRMERVLLPLKTITDAFPEALQPLIAEAPEPTVMIALPVDRIVAQLPKGRVEVAISQLRRVAPPTIFIAETDWDDQTVEVPLRDLLPKLDPSLLKRRTQRRVDLTMEEDIFQRRRPANEADGIDDQEENAEDDGSDDLGMTLDAATAEEEAAENAAPAPIAAPTPRPISFIPPAPATPPAAPAPAQSTQPAQESLSAPKEMHALFGTRPPGQPVATPPAAVPIAAATPAAPTLRLKTEAQPTAQAPAPASARPLSVKLPTAPAPRPVSLQTAPPQTPAAAAAMPPKAPVAFKASEGEPAPIALNLQPRTEPIASTAPGSTVNPLNPLALSTPAPTPSGGIVPLPLHSVAARWPEAIREEIAALGAEAHIEYPLDRLGAALKRGKVALHWKELRSWIPAIHAAPSAYDDAFLELPLPVVAPLFMAASAGGRQAPQRRTVVDESIPSPFAPAAPAAPEPTPEPAQIFEPTAPTTPAGVESEPALTLPKKPAGALGLDDSIPSILVDRACALSGVAGSVIALKDGLLVAARTPNDFQAETIAAFLPQVFSRVESAAGSMQIGEFQTLMFTAGDRPWQIWKAGTLFFAAIGRPNELLPSAQLKIIAGQLARQTKG